MTLLVFYLLLALVVSFFCSLSEAVLLSVRPAFVEALDKQKAKGAKALQTLRDNLNKPLAAILTLNTIAHTVGAAGVGAQSAIIFGNAYVGVTSAVLTLLILVLSEIIPKSLGAAYWPQLSPSLAPSILFLTRLLFPFVWASQKLTDLFGRGHGGGFSRDELAAMAEMGAREGQLEQKELKIVNNLLRLQRLPVRDVMTPRTVIFMAPKKMTVGEYFDQHASNPFTRIPIYGSSRDDVDDYVLKDDLFAASREGESGRRLEEFRRPCPALPDFRSVSETFDFLVRERAHLALLVDEYGTLQGLVTLEDIFETLVGLEITDELDTIENMQALAHRKWRERITAQGVDPESFEPASPPRDSG